MAAFLLFYLPLASPLQEKIDFPNNKGSHILPVNITSNEKGKTNVVGIANSTTKYKNLKKF